ncbi:glycosyltransferase family 4 protein [Bacillus sp. OK048]|uniref:glycosyltransferase family 4 protein n=1 Tax=Bacillus sp. OK048 TaxID=1882761 RepID=UPI00088D55E4|nr:glycosyltransferase family 4 protein [Bacillus sp. OK048]SDN56809.1 Glycosyltransferase involved in cell wall bisynthesis [Bacillus sp. OK048]
MKKILFYQSRPEWGGAQKCELELLVGLEDHTIKTHFLSSTSGPMIDRVRSRNKEVTIIPINGGVDRARKDQLQKGILSHLTKAFLLLPHFYRVLLFIIKNNIDIIYTSQFRSQLVIGWLGKLLGKKVIWHIHGEENLNNLLGKICLTFTDKIVVVSDEIAKRYKDHFSKHSQKFVAVHNGLDIQVEEIHKIKQTKTKFSIVTVGFLIEGKRQDLVLQACARLKQMGCDVEVKIIGVKPSWTTNEYKNYLHTLVEDLQLTDSVHFLGWIENPLPMMNDSDVFVLPSDTEGLPLAIIEAMGLGLPCIATNVGGIPELIVHGKNGYLIEKDNAEALVEGIKHLIDDPELLQQMSKLSRERYEQEFTREAFLSGVKKVLEI